MKIIHVGQFHLLKAKGAYIHSVAPKLSNGMIRNGHRVFDFSDRDMARAGGLWQARKLGVGHANRLLAAWCADIRPDLLVLGHADVILPATIAAIRREHPGLRVVQWSVDSLFEPDNVARINAKREVVDATLVSSHGPLLEGLKLPGKITGFMPSPVDASVETGASHERFDLAYDLFCAAGPSYRRRIGRETVTADELLSRVKQAIPKIRCCLGMIHGAPHLKGHAYQDALAESAIGINLSRRNDVPLYSSDRLAHLAGNGLAVLIDRANGYDALFGDDEFCFFATIGEMIEKLRWLIGNPAERAAIATAGRARYLALFNERVVAKYLVDAAFGAVDPADYEWPTVV